MFDYHLLSRFANTKRIYYDDSVEMNDDMTQYKDKYVKLIVVNKKDLYQFDQFVDKLLQADCHEVSIFEEFYWLRK